MFINRSITYFIITILLILPNSFASNLVESIDKLVQEKAGDLNYGIVVVDLDSRKDVLTIHPKRLFIPASLTKIVTAYYVLEKLGPAYEYRTSLQAEHLNIKNGKLTSDLYLKFSGDPTLKDQDLAELFAYLKTKEISEISSSVIIDDTTFDKYWAGTGVSWDDQPFCYAAPTDAIIINSNCSKAYMKPAAIGKLAELDITQPYILDINNTVLTVKPQLSECPYKSKYLGENKYSVYGCMFSDMKKEVTLNFAIPDTRKMAENYIRFIFNKLNIKFSGSFKYNRAKGKALITHLSNPIKDMLPAVLKDSDNLTSSCMFKTISANNGIVGGNEESRNIIKAFLNKHGINTKEIIIYEGTGESRYNLLSANELVRILINIYNDEKLSPYFLKSLPEHAKDGTLEYRENLPNVSNKVFAKTGSLKSISGIAGYYLGNKKYAFAIMLNNHNLSFTEIKSLEDKIVHLIFTTLSN
jgi:D-alanyl-D-alanine carboxypeptidase/D-alanyl-D-alanine-endopeptidase (penicillin-binding protein 4)